MQSRMPIVMAIVVAVLAVFLTNVYVDRIRREAEPERSQVLVAARELAAGTILERKDLSIGVRYTKSLPKLHVPASELNLYLGQELQVGVSKDDYILATYFGGAAIGERRLAQQIDAKLNQRALTIPVDNEQALEGSLVPGDRVDLIVTYTKAVREPAPATGGRQDAAAPRGEARQEHVTVPLLENVYVLATGRYGGGAAQRYRSVTVLLSPDEAKLLIWAMNLGKLSTLLRNPKDLSGTDRAMIAGDRSKLDNLSSVPLNIPDVIRKSGEAANP